MAGLKFFVLKTIFISADLNFIGSEILSKSWLMGTFLYVKGLPLMEFFEESKELVIIISDFRASEPYGTPVGGPAYGLVYLDLVTRRSSDRYFCRYGTPKK